MSVRKITDHPSIEHDEYVPELNEYFSSWPQRSICVTEVRRKNRTHHGRSGEIERVQMKRLPCSALYFHRNRCASRLVVSLNSKS